MAQIINGHASATSLKETLVGDLRLLRAIDSPRDVKAMHPENMGFLTLERPRYVSPMAASAFHLPDNWLDLVIGDASFDSVAQRVRAITPVLGGIGPVMGVWLLQNTVSAARLPASLPTAVESMISLVGAS